MEVGSHGGCDAPFSNVRLVRLEPMISDGSRTPWVVPSRDPTPERSSGEVVDEVFESGTLSTVETTREVHQDETREVVLTLFPPSRGNPGRGGGVGKGRKRDGSVGRKGTCHPIPKSSHLEGPSGGGTRLIMWKDGSPRVSDRPSVWTGSLRYDLRLSTPTCPSDMGQPKSFVPVDSSQDLRLILKWSSYRFFVVPVSGYPSLIVPLQTMTDLLYTPSSHGQPLILNLRPRKHLVSEDPSSPLPFPSSRESKVEAGGAGER